MFLIEKSIKIENTILIFKFKIVQVNVYFFLVVPKQNTKKCEEIKNETIKIQKECAAVPSQKLISTDVNNSSLDMSVSNEVSNEEQPAEKNTSFMDVSFADLSRSRPPTSSDMSFASKSFHQYRDSPGPIAKVKPNTIIISDSESSDDESVNEASFELKKLTVSERSHSSHVSKTSSKQSSSIPAQVPQISSKQSSSVLAQVSETNSKQSSNVPEQVPPTNSKQSDFAPATRDEKQGVQQNQVNLNVKVPQVGQSSQQNLANLRDVTGPAVGQSLGILMITREHLSTELKKIQVRFAP